MTDIVERLNRGEGCLEEGGKTCISMDAESGCLCAIAADEITRLTAEVEQNAIDLEEYRRDVERLRAALRWFVDEYDKVQPMRQARVHAPDCRCVLCACDNARAALEAKQ